MRPVIRHLTPFALGASLLIAPRAKSQGFDEWIIRANAADSAGHFAEAARLYERAYAMSGFDPTSLALAAMSAAKAGQDSLALADLRRAIEQGFLRADFLHYLEGDSAFARIRADPRFMRSLSARPSS